MSDVSVTEPSNPASEPIVDDGEEEETKVCRKLLYPDEECSQCQRLSTT